MNKEDLKSIFDSFDQLNAMVVGDVMIDSYYWGVAERISPEAPVPIVHVNKYDNRLGGAANVALNLMALGAKPFICSVIGDDEKSALFHKLLDANEFTKEGILTSSSRTTTVKTRIIAEGQHMLRVDEEDARPLDEATENIFLDNVQQLLDNQKMDVIILEDYNKGVLTERVIEGIIRMANERKIPTTVDPKKDHFFAYKNCTLFKPNLKELKEGVKMDFDKNNTEEVLRAIETMEKQLNNKLSLTTLSELGVLIKSAETHYLIPAHKREIMDVSGAGDTVISVASLCLALNLDMWWIAAIANLAGGLVCENVGVVPINKNSLLLEAQNLR